MARLARLARVWGDVQYRHPYLWEGRGIDWDAALAVALPKTNAATNADDEAAAVEAMLDVLHDPVTRVVTDDATPETPAPAAPPPTTWPTTDVLVLKLSLHRWGEFDALAGDVTKEVQKAKALVVDLREADDRNGWLTKGALDDLAPAIVSHPCSPPPARAILHSGYRPQRGTTSGGYYTAFASAAPRLYEPGDGPHPARVVFVVNEPVALPAIALAMQRVGDAKIIAQGKMTEPDASFAESDPLDAKHRAVFRTQETDAEIAPDVTLPDAPGTYQGGAALDAAVKLAKTAWTPRAAAATPSVLPPARWAPDATYPHEAYPPIEHRLLALFRFWNVIRVFYPYLHLMEPGAWDRVLTDFIPRLEQAKDAREYALTVTELATRVPDSHVDVDTNELWKFFGRSMQGLTITRIDGLPVVIEADERARAAGLRLGDVVVSIDGTPFEERAARVRPYIAASNAWTLARDSDLLAFSGPKDSEAVLKVRGADGEREVRLKRIRWTEPAPKPPPHYRTIGGGGGIGYADMADLTTDEVDAMFVAFAKTRGIVFDMRGYPQGTGWLIAAHLNVHANTAGPMFFRALVGGVSPEPTQRISFVQPLPNDDSPNSPKYSGKTVMLINEQTQSQAEHTGLTFEAANGTKFIGSPSAGANGDITNTCLPGEICISFSGHDVRHADGRQLQRVGLKPDVEVRPTIPGLRAGRDEVLERALVYLRDGR